MRNLMVVVSVGLVLILGGCTYTPNMQFSNGRSSGDTSSTAFLDFTETKKLDTTKKETIRICDAILEFLKDGQVQDLMLPELKEKILAMTPDAYKAFVLAGIAFLESQKVPVEKIGELNILRIKAYFIGAKMGVSEYLDKYHPVDKK